MEFNEYKEQTASDCEEVAEILTKLAADIREGNMNAFEAFWWESGTEEGDAKILDIQKRLLLRYIYRQHECGLINLEEPLEDDGHEEDTLDKNATQSTSDKPTN